MYLYGGGYKKYRSTTNSMPLGQRDLTLSIILHCYDSPRPKSNLILHPHNPKNVIMSKDRGFLSYCKSIYHVILPIWNATNGSLYNNLSKYWSFVNF